ncbi:hypothetical protein PR048_009662 [Dryococelus australis]|uniref:Uncharacterized protein n=1 Tax=Dryococelus australis TaxID=614101 RepID=A0ABQ9I1J9_9NEOP|nr:hypothetical protein PR048_009662 [Dryococelus australis]
MNQPGIEPGSPGGCSRRDNVERPFAFMKAGIRCMRIPQRMSPPGRRVRHCTEAEEKTLLAVATRSSRPATAVTLYNIQCVDDITCVLRIDEDCGGLRRIGGDCWRRSATEKDSIACSNGKGSVMSKVFARWVPKILTNYDKDARKTIATNMLQRLNVEGEECLAKIMTGERHGHSMELHLTMSPTKKKFKTMHSAGKVTVAVFWGAEHVILTTGETAKFGWAVLPHPPYRPDFAPSYFYLIFPVKEAHRGYHFVDTDNLKNSMRQCLRKKGHNFYSTKYTNSMVKVIMMPSDNKLLGTELGTSTDHGRRHSSPDHRIKEYLTPIVPYKPTTGWNTVHQSVPDNLTRSPASREHSE